MSRDEESIGTFLLFLPLFFFPPQLGYSRKFKTTNDRNGTNAIIVCAVKSRQRKKREGERGCKSRLFDCLTSKGSFVI